MDSDLLTRGLLYLSVAAAGIPGNAAVVYAFLSALARERRLLPADAVVLHLALANLLVAAARCLPEALATFGLSAAFGDAGCKSMIFVYRTSRSLSIWLTFVLSAYQCLSVAPPGSRRAAAREALGRLLWAVFLAVWVINVAVSSPSAAFSEGARNDSGLLQNGINAQFCFVNFPSGLAKDASGAAQTVRDVVPMALMAAASLLILRFLRGHGRRRPGGPRGGGAERRAAVTVVTLVTVYVVLYGVDNGLWIYTIAVRQTMASALVSDLRVFFSSLYAAISPAVIIASNNKVKKHLGLGRGEGATPAPEPGA